MTGDSYCFLIKTFNPRRSKFRHNAFSSLVGDSPPASSAFSDEIYPRRGLKAFNQKSVSTVGDSGTVHKFPSTSMMTLLKSIPETV